MRLNKQTLYGLFVALLLIAGYQYREWKRNELQYIKGNTMGTTYNIKYLGEHNMQTGIDSVLKAFNMSLSTYIPESEISMFNETGSLPYNSRYFYPVLQKSDEIYRASHGAFDPTVMPLVRVWGFGPDKRSNPDSVTVDSVLQVVGFNHITYDEKSVRATKPGVQLDFSAIAKGYGADVVAQYLKSNGILNYMVEIGGEIVCSGRNENDDYWTILINNPSDSLYLDEAQRITQIRNQAIATSGDYLNYYIDSNGVKRAHTLNPRTGYPVQHSLLSASVKAKDCGTADGYATALMVLGTEKGKTLLQSVDGIEAFLIYDNQGALESWSTPGFFNDEKN